MIESQSLSISESVNLSSSEDDESEQDITEKPSLKPPNLEQFKIRIIATDDISLDKHVPVQAVSAPLNPTRKFKTKNKSRMSSQLLQSEIEEQELTAKCQSIIDYFLNPETQLTADGPP